MAASSDMAGSATTAAATATATATKVKPARERTKAELMQSVAKLPRIADAAAMDD